MNGILRSLVPVGGTVVGIVALIGLPACQQQSTPNDGKDAAAAESDHSTSAGTVSVADVVQANSEVIDELGRAAAAMTECSDVIMRYSHFTDNHTVPVLLCPECSQGDSREEPVIEDPPEDTPETMEQLLRDAHEIRNSVAGMTTGMKIQLAALKRHLDQLRESAP